MLLVKKIYKGFSYIEILIVLAVASIAASFILPFSMSELSSTRVQFYATDVNSTTFGVQQNAHSQIDGSAHGIRFNTDSYDVFVGDSFATATSSYNISMENDVEFTSVDLTLIGTSTSTTELVFERGKFKPEASGTVTVSDGSQSYLLTVNDEGLIYYEKI